VLVRVNAGKMLSENDITAAQEQETIMSTGPR
jgi:hypothetical protein